MIRYARVRSLRAISANVLLICMICGQGCTMHRPRVYHAPYGQLSDGRRIELFTLANAHGIEIHAMTYGAIITSIRTPDRTGALADIVLGFDSLNGYLAGSPYFGAVVGPMKTLRIWIVLSWIALPTVMFGGYSLLRLLNHGNELTPFQATWFRAGHAHAGVLLILSLLLQLALDEANLPLDWVWPLRVVAVASVLLVSGGFFAAAHAPALRTILYAGALCLSAVVLALGIGLIRAR